jgi:hypothetical protein
MYNKLCNKQDGLFSFSGSFSIKDNDHQMGFKKHTNYLIWSSSIYLMTTLFSFFYHVLQC